MVGLGCLGLCWLCFWCSGGDGDGVGGRVVHCRVAAMVLVMEWQSDFCGGDGYSGGGIVGVVMVYLDSVIRISNCKFNIQRSSYPFF